MALGRQKPTGDPLAEAFTAAIGFAPNQAASLRQPAEMLQRAAAAEVARGPVALDGRGFSAGMREIVLAPARALLGEWKQARAGFNARLGPYRADIERAERLDADLAALIRRRDEDLAQIERETEQSHRYRERRDAFERAETRLRRYAEANGNRHATMTARSPLYLLALFCVGVTEWLINYTVFLLFFGIPAIAAGTTLILAVLLAFASHGHGSILKQWTHRFGHHAERIKRIGDWRLLVLATLALAVVLGAAGGSRYVAAEHVMRAQAGPNILGPDVVVQTDPTVEVLISLLANLGAWLVGIFFAYVCHDIDPEFMDATAQRKRAWRRFHRLRRVADERVRQTEARTAKELREAEVAASTRMDAVAQPRALLDQIEAHERAVREAVLAAVRGNAEQYRAGLAAARSEGTGLVVAGGEQALSVDRALLLEMES